MNNGNNEQKKTQIDPTVFEPKTFDPTSLDYTMNPQAYFPAIHNSQPVFFSEIFQAWMVYDFEVGKRVISDKRFSRDRDDWQGAEPIEASDRWPLTDLLRAESPFVNEVRHKSNRALYAGAFKPRSIERMEQIINSVIEEYCSPLQTADSIDIVDMVHSIPNTVISRIIGVSKEAQSEAKFKEAASLFLLGVNPFATDENKDLAEKGTAYIWESIGNLVDARLQQPEEDLVSSLLEGVEDKSSARQDIILSVASLLSAGTDTTRHSVGFALKKLLNSPELFQQLRDNRDLMDTAVLELLRYEFPAKYIVRFAKEDIEIEGHVFPKGSMVLTTLHGCGWDPKIFPSPEKIDFNREQKPYLVFGHGEYYCLGAHLAKFQIKQILNYFLDHLPEDCNLDEADVEWETPDFILRGLAKMPLSLR